MSQEDKIEIEDFVDGNVLVTRVTWAGDFCRYAFLEWPIGRIDTKGDQEAGK